MVLLKGGRETAALLTLNHRSIPPNCQSVELERHKGYGEVAKRKEQYRDEKTNNGNDDCLKAKRGRDDPAGFGRKDGRNG